MFNFQRGNGMVVAVTLADAQMVKPYLKYSNFMLGQLAPRGFRDRPEWVEFVGLVGWVDGVLRQVTLGEPLGYHQQNTSQQFLTKHQFQIGYNTTEARSRYTQAVIIHNALQERCRTATQGVDWFQLFEALDRRLPDREDPGSVTARQHCNHLIEIIIGRWPDGTRFDHLVGENPTDAHRDAWQQHRWEAYFPWCAKSNFDEKKFKMYVDRMMKDFAGARRTSEDAVRKQLRMEWSKTE